MGHPTSLILSALLSFRNATTPTPQNLSTAPNQHLVTSDALIPMVNLNNGTSLLARIAAEFNTTTRNLSALTRSTRSKPCSCCLDPKSGLHLNCPAVSQVTQFMSYTNVHRCMLTFSCWKTSDHLAWLLITTLMMLVVFMIVPMCRDRLRKRWEDHDAALSRSSQKRCVYRTGVPILTPIPAEMDFRNVKCNCVYCQNKPLEFTL